MPYQLLADAVLVLHFGVAGFVVAGLPAIVAGNALGWRWVNGWWIRRIHLLAIAIVAVQAWLGRLCPLTVLESWLRTRAGGSGYTQSFVAHWLQRILFHDAPMWLFAATYTAFALLVAAAWWYFPPHPRGGRPAADTR